MSLHFGRLLLCLEGETFCLNLARFITQLNRIIGYWISFCVLIIFALLLADVVMRYLIGQPAIWTAELATLIFGVYAIIGGGYLLTERGHVNVDIIYGQFSPKRKALVDIVTWPLFLIFVGVLLWQGYDIASEAIADMERVELSLEGPAVADKIADPRRRLAAAVAGLRTPLGRCAHPDGAAQ